MSKNYIDKMKYTTQYIGKSPKKNKNQEELNKLTAEIPGNWREAFSQLSSSISQIGSVVGNMTGGLAGQMLQANTPDWTYRPDPNMYTIQPAIYPNTPNWNQPVPITPIPNINWDQVFQGGMPNVPTPRFFAPSNNGVFFPCP